MSTPDVKAFFDEATFTVSYVVSDLATKRAAVIDPVLDYDSASGRTDTSSADEIVEYLKEANLDVDWIIETHVHADHLSGAPYLQQQVGGQTGIGANVTAVQSVFRDIFNIGDLATDGSQFDHLFVNGESFKLGEIDAQVIATPGHTPACITYVIGDSAFVGQFIAAYFQHRIIDVSECHLTSWSNNAREL